MLTIKHFKVLSPNSTIKLIKKKLTPNKYSDGISACTLETSLLCPLGKKKMKLPCRAIRCKHIQCFEASSYLKMNKNKTMDEWFCPLCGRLARYQDLYIDKFLKDIISKVPKDSDKVQFNEDGSWAPLSNSSTPKLTGKSEVSQKMSKKRPLEIILDDISYESKTFHDTSLPIKVEKRHAEEKSVITFQSKTSLAESNASIGSKPIENEAYSSHLLVSSASHSNLKIPVIDLEPTTSIKTSTIPVASAQESGPNDSSFDFKANTSLAESNASIGSPTISTKISTIPVASAQESGPVYRLDFASYLEYLEMTNQTYIPSKQYLESIVSSAPYPNVNHYINSTALSNSIPVASVKLPSQNSEHVIDEDSDVEIID